MPWNPNDSLSVIARQAEEADFGRKWEALLALPEAIIEACWREVDAQAPNLDAGRILIHRCRAAFETTAAVGELCPLAQLINRGYSNATLSKDAGHELVTLLESRLWNVAAEKNIPPELLRKDPMQGIEAAFFGLDRTAEDVLAGGLLMLGRRGVGRGNPAAETLVLAYGLRAVYAFYRARHEDLGDATLRRCQQELGELRGGFDENARTYYGAHLAAAAGGAALGGFSAQQFALLQQGKDVLPRNGDEYANCLWQLGEALQTQGRTVEALEAYEQGVAVGDISEPRLKSILQASYDELRADLEGDPSRLMTGVAGLPEAFGDDSAPIESLRRASESMLARTCETDAEKLALIEGIQALVTQMARRKSSADDLLKLCTLALKVGVELPPAMLGGRLASLIEQADALAPEATPAAQLDLEQMKGLLTAARQNRAAPLRAPQIRTERLWR